VQEVLLLRIIAHVLRVNHDAVKDGHGVYLFKLVVVQTFQPKCDLVCSLTLSLTLIEERDILVIVRTNDAGVVVHSHLAVTRLVLVDLGS
jgi:uncharacterized protein (UPF0262 family)